MESVKINLDFFFKSKMSFFGTFLIILPISYIFYKVKKYNDLVAINQLVQNVNIEKEKIDGTFKYGTTNLNLIYLYVKLKSNENRFYLTENVGNDNSSQYLEKISSDLLHSNNLVIYVDRDELNEYSDVEIKKIEINHVVVFRYFENIFYLIISVIIGVLLLILNTKRLNSK